MITESRLKEIEALYEAATDGPWELHVYPYPSGETCFLIDPYDYTVVDYSNKEDGMFIAASRQVVPELVSEVRRLQAIIEAQEEVIAGYNMLETIQVLISNNKLSVEESFIQVCDTTKALRIAQTKLKTVKEEKKNV